MLVHKAGDTHDRLIIELSTKNSVDEYTSKVTKGFFTNCIAPNNTDKPRGVLMYYPYRLTFYVWFSLFYLINTIFNNYTSVSWYFKMVSNFVRPV